MRTSIQHIFVLFAVVATCFACDFNSFPAWPEASSKSIDTIDCSKWDIPAGSITVAKALEIGRGLGSGKTSSQEYLIKGVVTGFGSKHESAMIDYGNAIFYIKDNVTSFSEFYCYQIYSIDAEKFSDLGQVQTGDFVVVKGKITNYNGTIETEGQGAACLAFSTNKTAYPQEGDTIDTSKFPNFPKGTITVAKARKIGKALASGEATTEEYLIKGRVKSFGSKHNAETIKQYGNAYIYIHDSENASADFYGYQVKGLNGKDLTSMDQIQIGDFVVIKGKIYNYKGTIETEGQGKAYLTYSTNDLLYPTVVKEHLKENFSKGLGNWTEQIKSGEVDPVWTADVTSETTGAVANSSKAASESWLVSPEINVGATHANPVQLTFSHFYRAAKEYCSYAQEYLRVKVRDNAGQWHDMEIQNFNVGTVSQPVEEVMDITPYCDGTIQIAFAYKCDSVFVPNRWKITDLVVTERTAAER